MSSNQHLEVIQNALSDKRGAGAKAIAFEGLELVATLLRKNADYGSSAWNAPLLAPGVTAREAIQTRMSDKISRLAKLLASGNKAEVEESVEDTMLDLAGYALLWLTCPTDSKTDTNDGPVSPTKEDIEAACRKIISTTDYPQKPPSKRSIINGEEYTCLNSKPTGPMVFFKVDVTNTELPIYYSKNMNNVDWYGDGTPRRVNQSMSAEELAGYTIPYERLTVCTP